MPSPVHHMHSRLNTELVHCVCTWMRVSTPKRKASGVAPAEPRSPSRLPAVRSARSIRDSRCWKYSAASCGVGSVHI